jgi:hypothetical protein
MEQAIPAPTLRRYTPEEYRQICERTDQRLDYWEGIVTRWAKCWTWPAHSRSMG